MYDYGEGVPEDDKEAVKWHILAAEQGDARAEGRLGVMYDDGGGVPENDVYAYMWWDIASSLENGYAKTNKDIIAREMTSSQKRRSTGTPAKVSQLNYQDCK